MEEEFLKLFSSNCFVKNVSDDLKASINNVNVFRELQTASDNLLKIPTSVKTTKSTVGKVAPIFIKFIKRSVPASWRNNVKICNKSPKSKKLCGKIYWSRKELTRKRSFCNFSQIRFGVIKRLSYFGLSIDTADIIVMAILEFLKRFILAISEYQQEHITCNILVKNKDRKKKKKKRLIVKKKKLLLRKVNLPVNKSRLHINRTNEKSATNKQLMHCLSTKLITSSNKSTKRNITLCSEVNRKIMNSKINENINNHQIQRKETSFTGLKENKVTPYELCIGNRLPVKVNKQPSVISNISGSPMPANILPLQKISNRTNETCKKSLTLCSNSLITGKEYHIPISPEDFFKGNTITLEQIKQPGAKNPLIVGPLKQLSIIGAVKNPITFNPIQSTSFTGTFKQIGFINPPSTLPGQSPRQQILISPIRSPIIVRTPFATPNLSLKHHPLPSTVLQPSSLNATTSFSTLGNNKQSFIAQTVKQSPVSRTLLQKSVSGKVSDRPSVAMTLAQSNIQESFQKPNRPKTIQRTVYHPHLSSNGVIRPSHVRSAVQKSIIEVNHLSSITKQSSNLGSTQRPSIRAGLLEHSPTPINPQQPPFSKTSQNSSIRRNLQSSMIGTFQQHTKEQLPVSNLASIPSTLQQNCIPKMVKPINQVPTKAVKQNKLLNPFILGSDKFIFTNTKKTIYLDNNLVDRGNKDNTTISQEQFINRGNNVTNKVLRNYNNGMLYKPGSLLVLNLKEKKQQRIFPQSNQSEFIITMKERVDNSKEIVEKHKLTLTEFLQIILLNSNLICSKTMYTFFVEQIFVKLSCDYLEY